MVSVTLGILLILSGGATFVHMRSPHILRAFTYRPRRSAKRQAKVHPSDRWLADRTREYERAAASVTTERS